MAYSLAYHRNWRKSKGVLADKAYGTWVNMKGRCLNPNHRMYPLYGARGITVCEAWLSFDPFLAWCLSSGMAEGLVIDRIDNDKGYCPDNCRWVTEHQSLVNKRCGRADRKSPYKGVFFDKRYGTFYARIHVGEHRHHLGAFKDAGSAAHAYNVAARWVWGEFAFQNKIPGR
jgi:hypothetical protein